MTIEEIQAPPIQPTDPMLQLLEGMLKMQKETNQTLEKLSEKIDDIGSNGPKTEEDMKKELANKKMKQSIAYKVMVIKNIIPLAPLDQQLTGDMFNNGGIERADTNKRFYSEKEAKAYGDEIAPGKYRLLPVAIPVPEGVEPKRKSFNLQM